MGYLPIVNQLPSVNGHYFQARLQITHLQIQARSFQKKNLKVKLYLI